MPTPRKTKSTEDAPVRWEYDKIVPYAARSKPLPRPTPGIFDSPYVCLRINILWLPHIMGVLDLLTAWDAWTGANDGLSARDEIEKLLAAMRDGGACLEFGESLMLRQNPTNLCLLEQSVDGGDTWTLAFDFSKCGVIKAAQINYAFNNFNAGNTYTQNVWNHYQTNYDGTLGSIAPELPYGTTPEDAARDAALCAALVRLIDIVCEVSITFYREQDEAQAEVNVGTAIAAAVLTLIALAAAVPTAGGSLVALGGVAGLWGAGIGIGAAVGNALFDRWQNYQIDQFEDESAKDDVVCFLYDYLKGTDVTQTQFAAALDGHGLTGNAGAIADVTTEIIALEQNYAAFVEEWERSFSQTRLGIDLGCPCGDEPAEGCYDTESGFATLVSGAWVEDLPNMRFVRASAAGGLAEFNIVFGSDVTLASFTIETQTLGGAIGANTGSVELWKDGVLVSTVFSFNRPTDGGYGWCVPPSGGAARCAINAATGAGTVFDTIKFKHQHLGTGMLADVRGEVCIEVP